MTVDEGFSQYSEIVGSTLTEREREIALMSYRSGAYLVLNEVTDILTSNPPRHLSLKAYADRTRLELENPANQIYKHFPMK